MGMNIYTLDGKHIGKRFGAGIWCWDCKVSLNVEDRSAPFGQRTLDACPNCGLKRPEQLPFSSGMRELGFDKSEPREHTGIDGASGFTWAIGVGLGSTRQQVSAAVAGRRFVKTEYGDKWTVKQFDEMFRDIITEKELEGEFS